MYTFAEIYEKWRHYELLDSGEGEKLSALAPLCLLVPARRRSGKRACPQKRGKRQAQALRGSMTSAGAKGELPDSWTIKTEGISFQLSMTDFGHLWHFSRTEALLAPHTKINRRGKKADTARDNLFAYSGGVTLAAAQAGAEVCHLDASKGMVAWARENAALNDLTLPPSAGLSKMCRSSSSAKSAARKATMPSSSTLLPLARGTQGEVFKIEAHIVKLLESIQQLLSDTPLFILFSCHTPGFTPTVLSHLLSQILKERSSLER